MYPLLLFLIRKMLYTRALQVIVTRIWCCTIMLIAVLMWTYYNSVVASYGFITSLGLRWTNSTVHACSIFNTGNLVMFCLHDIHHACDVFAKIQPGKYNVNTKFYTTCITWYAIYCTFLCMLLFYMLLGLSRKGTTQVPCCIILSRAIIHIPYVVSFVYLIILKKT